MSLRVVDGLVRNLDLRALPERFSSVRVSIELPEMAAREIDSNTVALQKCVAGADQIDGQFIGPARLKLCRTAETFAIASAENAFRHVVGVTVRVNVYKLG